MYLALLLIMFFFVPSANADPSELPFISSTSEEAELSAIGRIRNWRAGKGGCTGVLISPQLALTAAHCVAGRPKSSFVFDPTTLPNLKRMGISRVIVHPDYTGEQKIAELYSDLAVLVMGTNVPAEYAEPIPVGPDPNPRMTFSIYGFLGPENPPLLGHHECQIVRVSPGVLGSDCVVASGMSGSPLMAGNSPNRSVVGIVVATVLDETSSVRTLIAEIDRNLLPKDLYGENNPPQSLATETTE